MGPGQTRVTGAGEGKKLDGKRKPKTLGLQLTPMGLGVNRNVIIRRDLGVECLGSTPSRFRHIYQAVAGYVGVRRCRCLTSHERVPLTKRSEADTPAFSLATSQ